MAKYTEIEATAKPLHLSRNSFVVHDSRAVAQAPAAPRPAIFEEAKAAAAQIDPAILLETLAGKYPPLRDALAGRDLNGLYKLVCDRLGNYDRNVFYVQLQGLTESSYDQEKGTRRPIGKTLALVLGHPGGIDALLPEEAPQLPEEPRTPVVRERRPLGEYRLFLSSPFDLLKIFTEAGLGSRELIEQLFMDQGLRPHTAVNAASALLNGYVIGVTLKFTPEALWISERCNLAPEKLFPKQFEAAKQGKFMRDAEYREAHARTEAERAAEREAARKQREAERAARQTAAEADKAARKAEREAAAEEARAAREAARAAEQETARQQREAERASRQTAAQETRAARQAAKKQARDTARKEAAAERAALREAQRAEASAAREQLRQARLQGALEVLRRPKSRPKPRARAARALSIASFLVSQRALGRITDPFERELMAALPRLRKSAQNMVRDTDRAEDFTLYTIEKALESRHSYDLGTNMLSWLYMILKNGVASEQRRNWRTVLFDPQEYMPNIGVFPGQQFHAELRDLRERILPALPPEQKEALLMAANGISYEEMAEQARCAEGTIKSRVSRGRAMIRHLSDPDAPPAETGRNGVAAAFDESREEILALADDGDGDDREADAGPEPENGASPGAARMAAADENDHLFDASAPYTALDTGWFVLRINNQSKTSFIKDAMISFTHDETAAFLNLWHGRNGQSPRVVSSIMDKLDRHDAAWHEIIQHDSEGYRLQGVARQGVTAATPRHFTNAPAESGPAFG